MDCADRYGAWFLATMESLRGTDRIREDARSYPNPEAFPNGRIRSRGSLLGL